MIKHRMIKTVLILIFCLSLSSCGMIGNADKQGTIEKIELEESGEHNKKGVKPEKESSSDTEKDPSSGREKALESSENNEDSENEQKASKEDLDESGNEEQKNAASSFDTVPSASVTVYEPERVDSDSLTWEFDDQTGTLSIHGQGPMKDYSVDCPEWEQYADRILKVVLDEGITSVGSYAFYSYGNLTEAVLPGSIEVVDDYAFYYDWELRTVSIPGSLKYVGEGAFYNTVIWEPQDLVFPEGCEYIGDFAFHSALKTEGIVSLPSTLTYLGSCAFTNCYLSDFIVAENNSVYCVLDHAIYTKDMKEMLMLAPYAALEKTFSVPEGVERVYPECFNLIRGVETIYIPASVKEIPEQAFFGNYDLKEIVVDDGNAYFQSLNGLLLSKDGTLLLAWPDGMQLEEIVIPDGVERLGMNLFYGRFDKTYTVTLPEGVKEIGSFSLPSMMAELSLPVSLEKIDDYVFYNSMSIDTINYHGTADDWQKISIGQGNDLLHSMPIQTK